MAAVIIAEPFVLSRKKSLARGRAPGVLKSSQQGRWRKDAKCRFQIRQKPGSRRRSLRLFCRVNSSAVRILMLLFGSATAARVADFTEGSRGFEAAAACAC
jgi:hypothetical protein